MRSKLELLISEALFCKLISSVHRRGYVVKKRQVPSSARKGRMMQEACAHKAKRLLFHFYVKAKTVARALQSMHIEN